MAFVQHPRQPSLAVASVAQHGSIEHAGLYDIHLTDKFIKELGGELLHIFVKYCRLL